jgi:hypothetical protein
MGTRPALISNLLPSSFGSGHPQNVADGSESRLRIRASSARPDSADREYHENNIVNLSRYESISSKHQG